MNLAVTEIEPPTPRDGEPGAQLALAELTPIDSNPLLRTTARDEEFRRLYERRHADMVRFAAFLTGDVTAADDVAQEAFAKVFDAWDQIADIERVEAYLKSTLVNIVHGRRR